MNENLLSMDARVKPAHDAEDNDRWYKSGAE
jgi:hypothetical protein